MTSPSYPAARAAAQRIYQHFSRHLDGSGGSGAELLPQPATIESMIDVAFWASLRREENYTPRISLAYASPHHVSSPLTFEYHVIFAAQPLTKLGPAVEGPGVHLCVWPVHGGSGKHENVPSVPELMVWGAARNLPRFCFVLEVVAPGVLIVKHSRGDGSGKFVNVAVFQGDRIKVIDQNSASARDRIAAGFNIPMQLAVAMRAHGRGGILLIVPSDNDAWRESVLHPISYSVAPAFRGLYHLMKEDPDERESRRWLEAFRRLITGFGGLTAVDGATILTQDYELLGFGAKIVRARGREPVGAVVLTEPVEGAVAFVAEPSQIGGTRHLAGAQFAHDQRDTTAHVASQDGRFTVFEWSEKQQMVCANRIDTLLL